MNYKVAFLIGSESDRKIAETSMDYFKYFNIKLDLLVMSAHRNPKEVSEFSSNARDNGYSILICGAGMAAHLGGAVKANTTLPVIGVPLPGGMMDGLDSLLSTVQMPKGVPVATMSVGKSGAINSAIFCAEVLSLNDEEILSKLDMFKSNGATISA
ncbi:MAG: 5-(carboxyamino)imidazole ribonucleotide mutase [Candidatus Marinimicrobia bacterium]|nr:5-(carboxyamino)imidazole ribonucleotide mutase [Candidatus Neomarinimicrobiota bacterium]|tara:strand:- start:433 stop:900 length:468 start_codon:yes stop_codon:yes gene_type:complete